MVQLLWVVVVCHDLVGLVHSVVVVVIVSDVFSFILLSLFYHRSVVCSQHSH